MSAFQPIPIDEAFVAEEQPHPEVRALRVGLDLGAHTSVFLARDGEREVTAAPELTLSVVGYPKEGILPGVVPENRRYLVGAEALAHRLYLDLVWPLERKSVGVDPQAARDFLHALCERANPGGRFEMWAVIGCPAHASEENLRSIRHAVSGGFSRVLLLPEPFLAAIGMRDPSRLTDPTYLDPSRNSIVVDIGHATTDFCLVQGFLPRQEEMFSLPFGGNEVDRSICAHVQRRYPDVAMTPLAAMRIKALHSFVGEPPERIVLSVPVQGRTVRVDVTEQVRAACEELMNRVVEHLAKLASHADPDAVELLMSNVIMTGGGSLTRNLPQMVERKLQQMGFETARVRRSEDPKRPVSRGALHVARTVRDDQWQIPL